MAEVTKHGRRREGRCHNCGCEFIADVKEIEIKNAPRTRIDDLGAWHPDDTDRHHFIKCPECKEKVILWTSRL